MSPLINVLNNGPIVGLVGSVYLTFVSLSSRKFISRTVRYLD